MRRVMLRSLARVLLTVAATAALLWLGLFVVIRQPMVARPAELARVQARPQALRDHVRFLAGLCSRDVSHPEQLDVAAEYVKQQFLRATPRVHDEWFSVRGGRFRNVVAEFGPEASRRPVLVVGAHYDVFAARRDCFPGADDNASGTAGLLELARLLATQPPNAPVELVAYTNEEPPFFGSGEMGSAIHAEALRRLRRPVRGMLCLEMIGDFHGEQLPTAAILKLLYPRGGTFAVVCGRWRDRHLVRQVKAGMQLTTALPVLGYAGPRSTLEASDHVNYWDRGYSAVMITDTAYLRNPNYHTTGDGAETLDYDAMASVTDGVFNAVLVIGSG